jgi:hypothetical protein
VIDLFPWCCRFDFAAKQQHDSAKNRQGVGRIKKSYSDRPIGRVAY